MSAAHTSAVLGRRACALVAAKSVAYSQGASGQHFVTVIARLGLVDTLKPKTIIVQGKPVGAAVAAWDGVAATEGVDPAAAGSSAERVE